MSGKQDEALKKAAACEAHARHAPSDFLRDRFRKLRDSWIRIANAEEMMSSMRPGDEAVVPPDQRLSREPRPRVS